MMELRKSEDRGHADHGWLDTRHSFSFADYYDPAHMGFGPLRVINEDRVAGGQGFGAHGHRDMEIISYVLEGELAHRDNMGNGSVIRAGDVQRMSAGRGVMHAEFNHAPDRTVHFLQIWIEPDVHGIAQSYEERHFDAAEKRGRLRLIASANGADGSLLIHQDARVYAGLFDGGEGATLQLSPGRRCYVHLARGSACINGRRVDAGDALKLKDERRLEISAASDAEIILFDLP